MSGGVQSQVNTQQAPGIAGNFASANPRYSTLAGQGGLVAGNLGLTVGLFAWASYAREDSDGAPAACNNFGSGPVSGFVGREQQGLITQYLQGSGMVIPAGFEVTLYGAGDFWVKNDGATTALPGQKAYASFSTGKASFAAPGAPAGATASAWTIAAATATFTGAITNGILTVTGAVTGTIYPGSVLSGGTVATGTTIGAQLSGTPGGDGTYEVNPTEQTVAAASLTASYGLLTLTTVTAGSFGVNDTLSGASAGLLAGTYITQIITGTGGSGTTAAVNLTQTATNGTEGVLTGATNVETSWYARSQALPGELVKISNVPGLG